MSRKLSSSYPVTLYNLSVVDNFVDISYYFDIIILGVDKSNSSINIPTYSHVVDKIVYKYSSLVLFGRGITLFLAIIYPHIIIF